MAKLLLELSTITGNPITAPINKGFLFAQLTANEIIFSDSINYFKKKHCSNIELFWEEGF